MKRLLFLISASFLFYACATTNQPGITQYKPVSEKRVYNPQYPFAPDGNIIIKRDNGFMGSALEAVLFVDKKKTTELFPGEYYQFKLPNGVYFLTLVSGEFANLGRPFERTLKLDISDESKVSTFRVFPMPTQGMVMEEVYE
jgi:hypothetical protein